MDISIRHSATSAHLVESVSRSRRKYGSNLEEESTVVSAALTPYIFLRSPLLTKLNNRSIHIPCPKSSKQRCSIILTSICQTTWSLMKVIHKQVFRRGQSRSAANLLSADGQHGGGPSTRLLASQMQRDSSSTIPAE
jgi:hypothetical protein